MGAAVILLLIGFGGLAAGVLIGRYYVPDDRQLRRTARHSRAYMRALSHLIARDHDTVVAELRTVVEENIEDVEPYFALGAMFRSRGEHERAIRVHQALALRERERRKLRVRAVYELGLDFRAAGMPRRATRALEEVLDKDPSHEGALRSLAALYEEQARFNEAAGLQQRLGKRRNEDTSEREHHLLVAAAQAALARDDVDSAKQMLKSAHKLADSAHFCAAAAELAAARGNHRGAKDRLVQALVADPGLAPHLLPGLIAAEEGLEGDAQPRKKGKADDLDDDDLAASDPETAQDSGASQLLGAGTGSAAIAAGSTALATVGGATAAVLPGVPLVPEAKPAGSISDRVVATIIEIEAQTGPRLELALIRAQLLDGKQAGAELARELAAKFPDALASRVAAARLALAGTDDAHVRQALGMLAGDRGALAWALRGRWQCSHCGHRPSPSRAGDGSGQGSAPDGSAPFSWRCGQCRRWGTLRIETGIEPPPVAPRERRTAPRGPRVEGLLGASPDLALPAATLDPGLSDDQLAAAGTRRSLLGRVGGWFSNAWRRPG